jgi:bifunctional non-homologous end joining protein LigD
MLASSGPVARARDGMGVRAEARRWRVLVSIDGDLTVRTRNGHNVTASVPELEPMVAALAGRSIVLDGELVARQGRPFDFYGLAPRLSANAPASVARRRARMPVTFAAFDVLYLDGETVTRQSYVERRALLEGLSSPGRPGARCCWSSVTAPSSWPRVGNSGSRAWWPSDSTRSTGRASAASTG